MPLPANISSYLRVAPKWERKFGKPSAAFALYCRQYNDWSHWHTAYVGYTKPIEGETDSTEYTLCTAQDWPTVLTECGFVSSKQEARRRGFTGELPLGYSEWRPSDAVMLSVWRQ